MLRFMGLPGTPDPYVKIAVFDYRTYQLFETADRWSVIYEKVVDINAVDNGKHSATTLHGFSLAWDLDVDKDIKADLVSLAEYLKMRLPPPYEIVIEADHVHVEWDTHKGK
jgi:hypothetical protein